MVRDSFDQEYIDKLRDGDLDTQRHFTRYFGDLLDIKLRNRLRSPQLMEEVRQETFLRVLLYLRRTELEHPERLGAFVNSVCNNVLFEVFRSEGRLKPMPEHVTDPVDETASAEHSIVTEQRCAEVRRILATMPEKDRELLRQLFFEERDKDEICRTFRVDRGYLRVLLHRAKNRFRAVMEQSHEPGIAAGPGLPERGERAHGS